MEISGSLCLPHTSGFLFTLYIPVTDNGLKEEPGARDIYDSKTVFLKTFIKLGIWESFYGKSGSRILRSRVYNLKIIRFNRHPDVSISDSRRRHIDHELETVVDEVSGVTHIHTHILYFPILCRPGPLSHEWEGCFEAEREGKSLCSSTGNPKVKC